MEIDMQHIDLKVRVAASLLGGRYSDFRSRDDRYQAKTMHEALDHAEMLIAVATQRAIAEASTLQEPSIAE